VDGRRLSAEFGLCACVSAAGLRGEIPGVCEVFVVSELRRFSAKRGAKRVARGKQTMRLTDPVADMLTRVRNALQARHQKVDIPASRLEVEIARS